MRSVCYLLMTIVIHGWKTSQLIATDGTQTNITAHVLSNDVSYTTKKMPVASRLKKPHGSALDTTNHQVQKNNEERAPTGLSDLTLKVAEAIVNIVPFQLKPIRDAVKHKKVQKIFKQGTAIDQNKFVSLLVDEFLARKPRWDHKELMDYMMMELATGDGKKEVPRAQLEKLMEAFHTFRSRPGMKSHADRMQMMLFKDYVAELWDPMIALWKESRLTPEEVSRILTGHEGDFLKEYGVKDAGNAYLLAKNVIQEYIKKHEAKNPNSDRAAHAKLLEHFVDQKMALFRAGAFSMDQRLHNII